MGLDVYLIQYKDVDADAILKFLWFSGESWAFKAGRRWNTLPKSERGSFPSEKDKAECREKLTAKARELGLPEKIVTDGYPYSGTQISFSSKQHPEWLVGDWYNLGITRAIMKNFTGKELDFVFPEVNNEPRYFRPDWSTAKIRLIEMLQELKKLKPAQLENFQSGLSKSFDYHLNQIEVMIETLDFVLNSGNPKQFILLWSD
jgi:hypothetical protein